MGTGSKSGGKRTVSLGPDAYHVKGSPRRHKPMRMVVHDKGLRGGIKNSE